MMKRANTTAGSPQKDRDQVAAAGKETRRRPVVVKASIVRRRCSLFLCLDSGNRCCMKARNLKIISDARRKKMRSMTILFLIFQSTEGKAGKICQKWRLLLLGWLTCRWMNPIRFVASQSGPKASRIKLHINLADRREKKICVPVSGIPH